ncbi:MAG: hypothetical protein OXT07_00130 [bacterium]|nr:hypothetical protein [bacterium]
MPSALVDGDNGLGQVVMTTAAEIAIAKATESRSRRGCWMNSTRSPAGWASTNWPTDFGEDELREVAQP